MSERVSDRAVDAGSTSRPREAPDDPLRPGGQTPAQAVGPRSRISAGCSEIADHRRMSPDTMRISLAGGDAAELDARIATLTAALPTGTQGTVSRGVVFNRHGMP